MQIPSFSELHKFLGELVGLLLSIFGAAELLLWQLKKLKRIWAEFKKNPAVYPESSIDTSP